MQDSVDIKMLIEVRGPEYVENIFALSQYSLVTGFLIGMREIILHIFQAWVIREKWLLKNKFYAQRKELSFA